MRITPIILTVLLTLGAARAARAQPCTPAPALVDLNQATRKELQTLPQVGPARADAIVRLRERVGGFRSLSQLLRVRGIGRATLRRLRPRLTLTPRTMPKPPTKALRPSSPDKT